MNELRGLVEPWGELSVVDQCKLLGLPRSSYYYTPAVETEENMLLMRMMDEYHLENPYTGVKGMYFWLRREWSEPINIKRVRRLMRTMGLEAIYPKPRTTSTNRDHVIYPYLLREIKVEKSNQVWCSDITYIPMHRGFMYLVAIMDWYSRFVLSWELSNSLDVDFCIDALDVAFDQYGTPDIFNTDQGSQFTSKKFTEQVQQRGAQISMDGKGRAIDNVFIERLWRSLKYEDIYLRCYQNCGDLYNGIERYFNKYNHYRPHQGLNGKTPEEVYYAESF